MFPLRPNGSPPGRLGQGRCAFIDGSRPREAEVKVRSFIGRLVREAEAKAERTLELERQGTLTRLGETE